MTELQDRVQVWGGAFTRDDIADFLEHEGDLADSHRLEEWLALWNRERAEYLVPYGIVSGGFEVAIIRDDYNRIYERIARLGSGSAHAQDPPSRLSRVLGRPRIQELADGSIETVSKFVLVESRPTRYVTWAGTVVHVVAPRVDGEGLELWRKEVRLVNAASEIPPMAFLI